MRDPNYFVQKALDQMKQKEDLVSSLQERVKIQEFSEIARARGRQSNVVIGD
jgi:hypothetical protein